jgi:hypothetical protein
MALTKSVSLRLPPDVVEWLKARAQAEERSLAFLVTKIVRAELQREAKAKPKAAKR